MRPLSLSTSGEKAFGRICDATIECLMIAVLAFMPFAFGTVDAWSEQVALALSGGMLVCLLLKAAICRNFHLTWSWALAPIGLFLLLAALQLIPMPADIVAAISPNTAEMKSNLLSGLPGAKAALRTMTLSFYPLATRRGLRLAMVVAAVFTVTINMYRSEARIKRLLAGIAIIGGAAATLALAQVATATSKIYWMVPSGKDIARGGPFVNPNNYSQFMNLSIVAALALLLITLKKGFRRSPVTLPTIMDRLDDKGLRPAWYLAGIIVLGITTVLLSLSRGGMISLLAAWAMAILVLALIRRLDRYGWIMAIVAMAALTCTLYVGFDAICDRLATLRMAHTYQGRWQLTKETLQAWRMFPVLGAGLATHRFIHPMFDGSDIASPAGYAENEYAQIAEETGIVGLVLVMSFVVVIVWSFFRCIRRISPPVRITAVALAAGFVAVTIHSFTDFGQHLLSNACLSAVFCGLLVSMSGTRRTVKPQVIKSQSPLDFARVASAVALLGVVAAWSWAMADSNSASQAEAYWHKAKQAEKNFRKENWAVTNENFADLISLVENAVQREPDNVLYRYRLNAYRWRSISRVRLPETGNLVLAPSALQSVRQIVDDLQTAALGCATFGPNYSLAGELRLFILNDEQGGVLIRRGYSLAPNNPTACFADALLDAQEGKLEDSLAKFRRAVVLNADMFRPAVGIYIHQMGRPDLALQLAEGDVTSMMYVASVAEKDRRHEAIAKRARTDAIALLRRQCDQPDAKAPALARMANICLVNNDYMAAASYFRRALTQDFGKIAWRLNFARALAGTGRVPEAIDQAGICLELTPNASEAKRLIAELRVRPEAIEHN